MRTRWDCREKTRGRKFSSRAILGVRTRASAPVLELFQKHEEPAIRNGFRFPAFGCFNLNFKGLRASRGGGTRASAPTGVVSCLSWRR